MVEPACCPRLDGSQGSAEWRQGGHDIGLHAVACGQPCGQPPGGTAATRCALQRGGKALKNRQPAQSVGAAGGSG